MGVLDMAKFKFGWTFTNNQLRILLDGDVVAIATGESASDFVALFQRDEHGVLAGLVISTLAAQAAGDISLAKGGATG